jgi:transposase
LGHDLDLAVRRLRLCRRRASGPAYGHPKDRRTDLKQIQAGIAVSGDGGIPVFAQAHDGNAAEIAQVTDTMRALQTLAGRRSFLLVGDSKLPPSTVELSGI